MVTAVTEKEERRLTRKTLVVSDISTGKAISVTHLALSVLCDGVLRTGTNTFVFTEQEVGTRVAANTFRGRGSVTSLTV